ncbi:MAG: hypothetical protein BWY65_02264 [Firmicutes bacterium ADurb.Bin373]|nr:MAG: hypothetical protein BWY65_02264 [Firmicutes bacterium ADurb.Bin373]
MHSLGIEDVNFRRKWSQLFRTSKKLGQVVAVIRSSLHAQDNLLQTMPGGELHNIINQGQCSIKSIGYFKLFQSVAACGHTMDIVLTQAHVNTDIEFAQKITSLFQKNQAGYRTWAPLGNRLTQPRNECSPGQAGA